VTKQCVLAFLKLSASLIARASFGDILIVYFNEYRNAIFWSFITL